MRAFKWTLVLAALLASPSLQALPVPEGKAAVIEAVIGKVRVLVEGKESRPAVGQALDFDTLIRTAANGRVSIRHADNAVSRLAPNTELSLQAPGKRKGVFMKLSKGLVRFLVGKRVKNEVFEVATQNAVAAVKGTDAEVGSDGESTSAAVFASLRSKALQLANSAGETIDLAPGQTSDVDASGFHTRELNKDDFDRSNGQMQGLPQPEVDEPAEEAEEASPSVDLGQAITDAYAEAMADLGLDSFLERDDRTGDLVAGRIAYDRNGDRTQISSYVLRAEANTIEKASFSERKTGPFKGISSARERTVWNTDLPEDWTSVAKTALDDPMNLDGAGDPIYWKKNQRFEAENPQGDLMEVLRDYQDPYFEAQYLYDVPGDFYYYGRGPLMPQGFSQGLYINSTPVHYLDWYADPSYYDYWRDTDPTIQTKIADPHSSYDYWSTDNYFDQDGSYKFDYYDYYSNNFLTTEVRVLSNDGGLQDLSGYGSQYGTYFLRDFRGIDNALNIELTFRSPLLSAPIDLMFIPEVFNQMDFFDVPVAYNDGGCCSE